MSSPHEQSSDIEKVSNALVLIEDLKLATAHEDWELIVPENILAGRALAWGIPVRHMPGIDCIYVAKRTEIRETALFRRAFDGWAAGVTIEEFIEARIAEDERIARAAAGAPWVAEADISRSILVSSVAKAENKQMFGRLGYVGSAEHEEYRQHIVRHDPARVLRQCAALRDAVEIMRDCAVRRTSVDEWDLLSPQERALQYIAAIWSDHPDYRQEWAIHPTRSPYDCDVPILQPGDRVGWIDTDGVLRIDTVPEPGEV